MSDTTPLAMFNDAVCMPVAVGTRALAHVMLETQFVAKHREKLKEICENFELQAMEGNIYYTVDPDYTDILVYKNPTTFEVFKRAWDLGIKDINDVAFSQFVHGLLYGYNADLIICSPCTMPHPWCQPLNMKPL